MKREPLMVADVVDLVARGRIGHCEAMERLGLDSYPRLLDTIHANGKTMWAHKARRPDAANMALLAIACGIDPVTSDDPMTSAEAPDEGSG